MIPILYDKNEIYFASNGLGRLRDCISCKVTEERNGIYECDFEYPVSGAHFDDIKIGRIIGVTHEESDDIQPFDIVSYSRPIDGVVEFHAVHISYRQSSMVTWATGISNLSDAFDAFDAVCYPTNPLGQDASSGNPFTYVSDKESTGFVSAFDGTPRTIRSLLGGVEGSILDAYGGEYEWDKWLVRLHSARGERKDFTIRYGTNLTEFTDETDYSELYNTCIPYWVNQETGTVVMGSEVSSGRSSFGVGDRCIPLDLTDKFEEQPSVTALESMALDVMVTHQSYLPSQNIKIDFVRPHDGNFQVLTKCKLCDSVRVIFPFYNMSGYYKIVKTVWNVLNDRYDDMELGNLSSTLSQALGVSSSGSYVGTGGGGEAIHYGLKIEGHDLTLVEGGDTLSVTIPDNNTTYSLSGSGTTVTLTPSSGTAQSVTITETDPTVPAWAKASSKPSYTASEVGAVPTTRKVNGKALSSDITLSASDVSALPASTSVPSKTSDLTNDSDFVSDANYVHTDNNFTTTLKDKLDGIASGAEVNQNAFSNVKVGTTTVEADSKTDTLELIAGANITLTPDATNDTITISSSGGGGTSEIFIAIYGTTTFAEAKAAYDNGKLVYANKNDVVAPLVIVSNTQLVFYFVSGLTETRRYTLNSSDTWSTGTLSLVTTGRTINGYALSSDITLRPADIGIHISTSDPTSADGEDGDIWIKYTAPNA